jgi:hypothetical protein
VPVHNLTDDLAWVKAKQTLGFGDNLCASLPTTATRTPIPSPLPGQKARFTGPKKQRHRYGAVLTGKTPVQDHMTNWVDCIRTSKTPNASVEIGHGSAVACHMANLAYRQKQHHPRDGKSQSRNSIRRDFASS